MTHLEEVFPYGQEAGVRRLLHQLAQPLATAALALDIALLAQAGGDSEEIRIRLNGAVDAVSQAQAILRAWSAPGIAPIVFFAALI